MREKKFWVKGTVEDRSYGQILEDGSIKYGFVKGKYPVGTKLSVCAVDISKEYGVWVFALWTDVLEVVNAIEDDVAIIESRFAFGKEKKRDYGLDDFLFEGTSGYLSYMEKVVALSDIYPAIANCTAPLKMKDAVMAVLKDQLEL